MSAWLSAGFGVCTLRTENIVGFSRTAARIDGFADRRSAIRQTRPSALRRPSALGPALLCGAFMDFIVVVKLLQPVAQLFHALLHAHAWLPSGRGLEFTNI